MDAAEEGVCECAIGDSRHACAVAEWTGELVVEGGGFCGVGSPEEATDLSPYDGISVRVKGGGETFKFNLKTADQARTCTRGPACCSTAEHTADACVPVRVLTAPAAGRLQLWGALPWQRGNCGLV